MNTDTKPNNVTAEVLDILAGIAQCAAVVAVLWFITEYGPHAG